MGLPGFFSANGTGALIFIYYRTELVRAEKEHSDWLPERSEFFAIRTAKMDCLRYNVLLKVFVRLFISPHTLQKKQNKSTKIIYHRESGEDRKG